MKVCLNCQEIEEDESTECTYCGYKELIEISVLIDMGRAYLSERESKKGNEWEC